MKFLHEGVVFRVILVYFVVHLNASEGVGTVNAFTSAGSSRKLIFINTNFAWNLLGQQIEALDVKPDLSLG